MGLDQIANLVDTDIFKIVFDIAASAQATVFLLLFLEGEKPFSHKRNKRKCSHTRFGLRGIGCDQDALAVQITRSNCVPDRERVLLKVNGIPFQSDCLTAAQAVECTEQNRHLKFGSLGNLKESVDFIGIIEATDIAVFLRTLNLVCRVYIDQVNLHGILECLVSASGALVKGLSKGNLIRNIPTGLEDYSDFLQAEKNSTWLKWQATGRDFMELSEKCPFCARDIAPQRAKIEQVRNEYDAKTVEHLSKILALFERLGHYFSEETNENVRRITMSVTGLSTEQKNYLVQIKNDVEVVLKKLQALKRIGFDSLKDVDVLAAEIEDKKIDLAFIPHLNTQFTSDKVSIVNAAIDGLMTVVGTLQGAINRQKAEIRRTIEKYSDEINSFLKNAGYSYTVLIEESADHSYKLKLKFGEGESTISGVKSHLSYGERNAFALVLFMYQAIYNQANLIVLDDPISSFDQNKKFAILDMLFIRGSSLRGKTVLMLTHDLEPVIDAVYNHPSFFEGTPKASFMENNGGELRESPITKDDIQSSIQIAKENIQSLDNGVVKAIYLRRLVEITEGKNAAWHLLSNLIHKRTIPVIGDDRMDEESIRVANARIREDIDDFDYEALCSYVQNDSNLIALYDAAQSNYEKLQMYRMLFDPTHEDHVLRKFLNETYHIENDYLFQLNPVRYNTIPNYIIAECDRAIDGVRERG